MQGPNENLMRYLATLRPFWLRTLVSFTIISLSFAISWQLAKLDRGLAILLNTAASLLAVAYGGFWPGMIASIVLSLMTIYWFLEPIGTLFLSINDVISFSIFLAISIFISALVGSLKAAVIGLKKSNEDTSRAMRLRENILGAVSHDLRTPLSSAVLGATFLRKELKDKKDQKMCEIIIRESERMKRLISDLLDYSSIDKGALPIMIRQENFASLVDEMRRVFEGTTSQTNIGFELVMGENLPTYFNTDKDRLLQCIGNLVSNAIRFSLEKAKVILAIQFTNGILEFSVLDQGRGISEESLPHIFEPYWKQNSPGAGLGLYIVKGIVDSLHGSMHVRRVATGGVCVSVRLPNMSETMWHKYLEAA